MFAVLVTPRAAAQVTRAALWWADNRPAAPGAIGDDFEEAVKLLARQPGAGARSSSPRYANLRRLYLRRIGYHVYYRVVADTVLVLAFWHASRGATPAL